MRHFTLADSTYSPEHSPPVKTEAFASPHLLPSTISSLQQYQFKFHAPASSSSHGSLPSSRQHSEPPALPQSHIFRFGSDPSYNLMSNSSWSPSPNSSHLPSASSRMANDNSKFELTSDSNAISYPDDYDDENSELVEISEGSHPTLGGDPAASSSTNGAGKHIRRRSSKGPSRKRGPPKGYIDAIEARLHQTEALLGIMMSASDPRAQSLLHDIGKDPLAKEIINRVDNSPYGVKGRKREDDTKPRVGHQASSSDSSQATSKIETGNFDLTSTHPTSEWQDRVTAMLAALGDGMQTAPNGLHRLRDKSSASAPAMSYPDNRLSQPQHDENRHSPGRRTRRRIGTEDIPFNSNEYPPSNGSSHTSRSHSSRHPHDDSSPCSSSRRRWSVSSADSLNSGSEDGLNGAAGQLSLNEDEQVRYHGKASGLHLLGNKERVDGRNEGGIWRFPKARVWPPLQSSSSHTATDDDEYANQLPDHFVQEHLLDLYFKHVHTNLPCIHKRTFLSAFRADQVESPESLPPASPLNRPQRVPTLLLFAMFAIASRYAEDTPKPPNSSTMWEAGDEYLNQAKAILDASYAASRPSTCQALLLMGYREVGIGAMAQAWTYIGMAIRMAQDLGMHRSADGWARAELGGKLFGDWELQERKRIWYTCVIMDVYVSTYIGRPLMIFERDFDTPMPNDDDPEELEDWTPSTIPENTEMPAPASPATANHIPRILTCPRLAGILGMIVQAIYAVRPALSRHSEAQFLEGLLDKWYIGLPENLRYDIGSPKRPTPPPHVLTLHMQYWCTVLLLHRPFSQEIDDETRGLTEKSYELCAGAANHITTIVTAHSADPQARMGLSRCMDILHLMEVLWPSAARALDLLRGSKDNGRDAGIIMSTLPTERRKRPAEQALNDKDPFNRTVPSIHSLHHDHLELRAPYTSQYAAYTPSGHEIRAHDSQSPVPSAYSSSTYDHWPSESSNSHSYGFSSTLSTSVLPQLYSTGLVEDRVPPSSNHRTFGHHPASDQPRTTHTTTRYPQYWNDFSTFPQLGTAYGGHHEPSPVPQQPLHSNSSHLYLSEHSYLI
ncbi:hypothetical protein DXG01_000588 [Tephrocybe rancida]|nr:hypothetical protein DXG01_000588 [Tephrocybe rancida]